jgi:hypothetical protein
MPAIPGFLCFQWAPLGLSLLINHDFADKVSSKIPEPNIEVKITVD